MLAIPQLRPASLHRFSLAMGIIILVVVFVRRPNVWSYAIAFVVAALALFCITRAVLFLLRSHCPELLNENLRAPSHDRLPCLLAFPIIVAWWMVAYDEPMMGSAVLKPHILEVIAVIGVSCWILHSCSQWPAQKTLLQRSIDNIYRIVSYFSFAVILLAVMAQFRTADMPSPKAQTAVGQSDIQKPVVQDCDVEASIDDDDESTVCKEASSQSNPKKSGESVSAATNKTAQSAFGLIDKIAQIPISMLDFLSRYLADTSLPFHLSSVAVSLSSFLKLLGRMYLLYKNRKISAADAQGKQVDGAADTKTNTGEPTLADVAVEFLSAMEDIGKNQAFGTRTHDEVTSDLEHSTLKADSEEQSHSPSVIDEVGADAYQVKAPNSDQSTSIPAQESTPSFDPHNIRATQAHLFSNENEQTLQRLQSLLFSSSDTNQALLQHKDLVQRLLVLSSALKR